MMRQLGSLVMMFALLGCLPACGFHPVYGGHDSNGSPVSEQMNQVAIDPIPDRAGQILRNDLIDNLYGKGRPEKTAYHLSIKLHLAEEDLGLLLNATSALSAVHVYADYQMKDAAGKVLMTGTMHSTETYDKLTNLYSTQTAHDEALERTLREVSEQLTARVSLYFSDTPKPPTP